MSIVIGARVTWVYTPRGGYGFSYPVDAEVVKVNGKTVRIRVKKANGAMVERNVKPESLKETRALAPADRD